MRSVGLSEFSGPEVPLSGLGMWLVSWKHKSQGFQKSQGAAAEKPSSLSGVSSLVIGHGLF